MDISQKIVWNVYSTGVTLIGGIVTKQLVDGAWTFVTGEEPPDPNDPSTPAEAALVRVLVIALGMGLTQVLINRFAARAVRPEELCVAPSDADFSRVIAAEDRQLVLLLVEASQDLRLRRTPSHGLLGNEATATVAALLGVCERTVRRRARRTIQALTDAAPAYTRVA